jgi:outer membrane protein assembly factor BamB
VSKDSQLICAARESGQIYWIKDLNAGFVSKKKKGRFSFLNPFGGHEQKPVWTGPILVNNSLVLASSGGTVETVNAKTGDVQRKVELSSPILLSPIVAGDTVYVVSDDAQLFALR